MEYNGSHQPEPPARNGMYLQPQYAFNNVPTNAAGDSSHASQWTSSQGYEPYGPWSNFTVPPPGVESVSGNRPPGFCGYDLPAKPDFSRPPPGHVPDPVPCLGSQNVYNQRGIPSFPSFQQQHGRFDPPNVQYQANNYAQPQQQHMYQDFGASRFPPTCPPVLQQTENYELKAQTTVAAEDETSIQRRKDQQWVRDFLQRRKRPTKSPEPQPQPSCDPELRQTLDGAARLVAQLKESCDTLRSQADNESAWLDSFATASRLKSELEDKLKLLESLNTRGAAASGGAAAAAVKRKERRRRAKQHRDMDERQREQRHREAEARIDAWRLQKIRQVEDKKREQELKLAADAVLCEVRKKQSDVKRMQDILRSLEKLRKLRKEAASRKCIVTELECEEAFYGRLEKLRSVLKSRTAVYATEEKALMVMLEGEQEEERMREREKQVKNEMDKWLQKKQSVDAMLFGDGFTTNPVLQAFTDYYGQAQHSLHTLLQIRKEWDVFVVAAAHPEGSPVPQDWVQPEVPSDHLWASSLHTPTHGT